MTNIVTPRNILVEKTAGEMAAVFYEAGRSTGLKSKYKNAREYAKANLEKFVPKAVEILVGMLHRQDIPQLMKAEIYEAILERANDKELSFMDLPTTKNNVSVIQNQTAVTDETIRETIKNLNPADFIVKAN